MTFRISASLRKHGSSVGHPLETSVVGVSGVGCVEGSARKLNIRLALWSDWTIGFVVCLGFATDVLLFAAVVFHVIIGVFLT